MLCLCLPAAFAVRGQQGTYSVSGRVIDRLSRRPVAYAAVVLAGQERKGASTDSLGRFRIERVVPGIWRLAVSSVGYKSVTTPEYMVSAATPFIEVELEEDAERLEAVTVRPSPFRATVESPVSLKVIGLQEIEKSPGSNRDVSRIVRSYPGVAFSPVGYRNDLIVRGGGPSENKFFMDGIEIPNINHFATQGATGGPVSIVNADLIQEISFYTGAFPADRAGALSSVLDFRLRDGNAEKQTFKATLGASDAGVSGSGHIGGRTTYVFSLRQSYLQLLFKMLGLPFLPNYIDGQVKVKTRLTERDELTVLALAGIDNMKLNVDEKGEDAEYLLSYLPRIRQETFTVGASWRHYAGRHVQTVTLSHNYLNNRNLKYRNNDASSEENLTLRLRSVEQKTSLRAENRTYAGRWTLRGGVELNYSHYTNRTLQRLYAGGVRLSDYRTRLGIVGWGLFAGADYASGDRRFTASAGLRADGCDDSTRMARPWHQLSPRASVSYVVAPGWTVSGSAGLYYQLPPYTALGFKEEGAFVNRDLRYMRVGEVSAG
ncbi:MAG: TonB-dependent receptor, partial [Alistipes dispar]